MDVRQFLLSLLNTLSRLDFVKNVDFNTEVFISSFAVQTIDSKP